MATYRGTNDFWWRYENDKRPMTFGEIRDALSADETESPPVLDRLKREWEIVDRRGGPKRP